MSKHQKPEEWHEFVPGDPDLNGNRYCEICHHARSSADHQRCADCGSYDIYGICGASCQEGRCKEHWPSHWCKSREEDMNDRGGR
jgi:hypothetical protein